MTPIEPGALLGRVRLRHVIGQGSTGTVYEGEGEVASKVHDSLRLTVRGGPVSRWTVPSWLRECGLSYHGAEKRWIGDTELNSVARGQEFVCDIGERSDCKVWVDDIIAAIRA